MVIFCEEEGWENQQKILIILAHPDDPEYFCGATIAHWVNCGHEVNYYLLTKGERGGNNIQVEVETLAKSREVEQRCAAEILGVKSIQFLDFEDGYLIPNIQARKMVTRVIRMKKPDILVSCDPTNYFPRPGYLNHPDHRAAGLLALEAVFPAAGNPYYFPELLEEGFLPHKVKEVWLAQPSTPDIVLDVTKYWDTKIRALHEHKSQIGEVEEFDLRMRKKHTTDSTFENPRYEEKFRRIVFS